MTPQQAAPDAPATWQEYTRSLDCIVMLGEPTDERISAAYCAGLGRQARPPVLTTTSPYLYDWLEEAFRLGRQAR